MSQLTLTLPETLQNELSQLAIHEGISLHQYILYALTRQVALAVQKKPEADVRAQQQGFTALLAQLGEAAPETVQKILSERETVAAEPELRESTMADLRTRLAATDLSAAV